MKKNTEEDFWRKAIKSTEPDGCWPWMASRYSQGYGQAHWNNKNVRANRLAWELTYGSIPEGLCVLHKCDNPPCVNPKHLFLGTVADNSTDMIFKGRQARGESNWSRLHPEANQGTKNGRAKLTEGQVRTIRLIAPDFTYAALGRMFCVTYQQIGDIVMHRSWKHLSMEEG